MLNTNKTYSHFTPKEGLFYWSFNNDCEPIYEPLKRIFFKSHSKFIYN